MWEPVGPLPVAVYWRRRGVAAVAALALATLSVWGVTTVTSTPQESTPTTRAALSNPQPGADGGVPIADGAAGATAAVGGPPGTALDGTAGAGGTGSAAPGAPPTDGAPGLAAGATPAAGTPAAGSPTAGTSAGAPGTGIPAAGAPAGGSAAGAPGPGAWEAGAPAGAPAAVAPPAAAADVPAAGAAPGGVTGTVPGMPAGSSAAPPPPAAVPPATTPGARGATSEQLQPDLTPRAAPVATPVAVPPTGPVPCTNAMTAVTAEIDQSTHKVGEHPVLRLVVTNTSPQPCVRDLDASRQEIVVWSGDRKLRLWSSNDCGNTGSPDLRTLIPGQPVAFAVTWAGRTSTPGCAAARTVVPAGNYRVMSRIDDDISAPTPFQLTP